MQTSGSGETSPASRLSSGEEVDVSNCFIVKMSRDVVCRLLLTCSVNNLVCILIKVQSKNGKIEAPYCKFVHTWVIIKLRVFTNLSWFCYFAKECWRVFVHRISNFLLIRFLLFWSTQGTLVYFFRKIGSKNRSIL